MVEAAGVEPASEELQSAASPCAVRRLISFRGRPADGLSRNQPWILDQVGRAVRSGPVHQASPSPDRWTRSRDDVTT